MKPTSPTIRKNLQLPIGLDYARLRADGIEMLQNLSGEIWTDYNEHDPGVTILEALCYALTDLTNRASQPIADLLAPPPSASPLQAEAPVEPTLAPAHKVFSNHPVTLNDYKKIVLDQDDFRNRVVNTWIELREGPQAMAGEYVVRIALNYNHHQMPELLQAAREQKDTAPFYLPADHQELARSILRVLNRHRGLGEEFVEVIFLEPYLISAGGHFEIRDSQQQEAALAEVLWQIDKFFETTIATRGLKFLHSRHVPTEEIFVGPLLENQLLQESEFEPQLTEVAPAIITPRLHDLECLHSVGELHLYEPGYLLPSALIRVAQDREMIFDVATTLQRFTISHRGVALKFDRDQALRKFDQLHSDRNRNLRSPIPKSNLQLPLPDGRHLSLGQYDSIQHSFPAVYGIGEGGPPVGASPAQRAQILQLKGYLLFFEQIMANFCAQLDNTATLLSARHLSQGFFAQPLSDVPGIDHLLYDTPPARPAAERADGDEQLENPDFEGESTPRDTDEHGELVEFAEPDGGAAALSQHYLRKLGKLAEDPSEFMQRRDTLLAHMLARFGYIVSPHHPTLTEAGSMRRHSIRVRERLLQHLSTAAYHRGAARVAPHDPAPAGPNNVADVSGLEQFIYLLTGLWHFQLNVANDQLLADLEAEVQLAGATTDATLLVVHGAALDFPAFLRLQLQQLAAPTLEAATTAAPAAGESARVAVPAYPGRASVQLELLRPTAQAPASELPLSAQQQVLAYLEYLDKRLNRFILIDHRTLKPASFDPAAPAGPAQPDRTFYEFEISVCLPDFTRQFQQTASGQYGGTTYVHRDYLQNLIMTHTPAHLLVHIIWLNYPEMKLVEELYQRFRTACGLLNPTGQDQPNLPGPQQQLTDFLRRHLSR